MAHNQLSQETSLYLLQHKDDPVHWRAWSDATLQEAAARQLPILLSIGYSACHWCHVMARESFSDSQIAALINERFTAIKVDREERPDLDHAYQNAMRMAGERGGWPLTVFLTPEGKFLAGGNYFPPEERWGKPAFSTVLRKVSRRFWRPGGWEGTAVAPDPPVVAGAGEAVDAGRLNQWAAQILAQIDPLHGGLFSTPKFPNWTLLELLWRAHFRTGDESCKKAVTGTLDRMCQGGIYDHLGGGIARYSTDARWLVPHFEKMLYDNAQFIDLLTWAWLETRSELYRQRLEETVAWLLRDMRLAEGGFASSIDADSGREEGLYYLWTQPEIESVLGPRFRLFSQHYDVKAEGNWEGKVVLHRLRSLKLSDPATEAALAAGRQALFVRRQERERPTRDDKILADWNGLLIAALAQAAQVFGRPDWLRAAESAWTVVTRQMQSPDHRLTHSLRRSGDAPGFLEDYAAMSRAALRLAEATGEPSYLAAAQNWLRIVETDFSDPLGGPFFMTGSELRSPMGRLRNVVDGPTPPGNAVLVEVYERLHLLTGDSHYAAIASALLTSSAAELAAHPLSHTALLNAADFRVGPLQIAIIGPTGSATTQDMLRVAREFPGMNRTIAWAEAGVAFPAGHPLNGKMALNGRPTAYVCEGPLCSLPQISAQGLQTRLGEVRPVSLSQPISAGINSLLPPSLLATPNSALGTTRSTD